MYGATGGVVKEALILCGGSGRVGTETQDSHQAMCYKYEKQLEEWKLLANLTIGRTYAISAVINGGLWIAGGLSTAATTSEYIFSQWHSGNWTRFAIFR